MVEAVPGVLLESVQFGYEPGKPILDIPELRLAAGSQVLLTGPSGGGKTTLLGLLSGVLLPSRGHVTLAGTVLSELTESSRDRFRGSSLGYLFQTFNLIPYLDLVANVALPCHLHAERRRRLEGQSPEAAARTWLERLDLGALAHRRPDELSVGQQQRAALARALIGAPRLVLADEPCSALDPERRPRFLELLTGTCRELGSTLLVVSHDPASASLFDRRLDLRELNRAFSEHPT